MIRHLFYIGIVMICATYRTILPSTAVTRLTIGPFSPADQSLIQPAIDRASDGPCVTCFFRGVYVLFDPPGLRVPARDAVRMEGACFLLDNDRDKDGQAFA